MTVDDLDLIRDLGRDLEHEPPPSLARQRTRLLDETRRGTRWTTALRWTGTLRWTLLGVVAAVTAAAILVPAVLLHGGGAPPAAGRSTAPAAARALNVLVIGLDARYGGPPRSDTLMLVHVPADRKRPQVMSIPRDVLVRIPACGRTPARQATVNTAFPLGGAACTRRTVEALTGVRIDQTVVIDFGGFKRVVDALGGVEVTLPTAVNDPRSGLVLPAGRHWLNGTQALAYVRVRHGLGDGSDLDRVKRQQRFLASLARQAKAVMAKDPVRFARFLAVAADSVGSTPKLDAGTLRTLARGFDGSGGVAAATIPVRPAPSDPNRLVVDEAAARKVLAPFRTR
ncbi:LCP family protein required for cell wall assembly [Actinomadura luteofluorescens]|uniref:LCP family protein required for cell wall assembly n=1 Tax=Actinomadura luteofluorescens TaxID=46163 RepID=A0A7Y9JJQ1_9ACTN|nr:LCP family protein [Actinomadura luteofluorescens]NYD49644.1 LCP family protein required for cell wall assembly [Actinomadura luteofluorescens]